MIELFLTFINMSLMASYVILFVILIRQLLKKAPKIISFALWGVVAFRLTIPFSFESIFSLMPRDTNVVPIPHDIIYQQSPQINSGIEVVDSFVNQSLPAPIVGASINPLQIYTQIGAYIWILGIVILLIYSMVSILQLKRQLKSAQFIEQNIFEAKNLKTPFVLGLIKPKIYLPIGLNASERNYILLHEQTHIRRKDHITKIFSFSILTIHWFNPLVWVAFILMSKDMELSCDEQVLKEMNEDIKKPYANSLLSIATGRHILNCSPLAFGEGNVEGRIKNVLNYKKPSFWVITVSVIVLIVAGIGLLSNPVDSEQDLSFLNPNNMLSLIVDQDQVKIVSSDYGNTFVSGSELAKWLDKAENQWKRKKVSSPYELSPSITIHVNDETGNEIRFYESEPTLAMIMYQNEYRYYKISKEDYSAMVAMVEKGYAYNQNTRSAHQPIMLPNFEYDGQDQIEKLVYATETEKNSDISRGGFMVVAPKVFGSYTEENLLKVFVTTYSARYKLFGDVLSQEGGSIIPTAITYRKNDSGGYILEKYEQAGDGAYFGSSIRKYCTMPASGKEIEGLADKILKHCSDNEDILILQYDNLFKHLKKNGITDATITNSQGEIEFTMSDTKYNP